jgi:hypothetical protein
MPFSDRTDSRSLLLWLLVRKIAFCHFASGRPTQAPPTSARHGARGARVALARAEQAASRARERASAKACLLLACRARLAEIEQACEREEIGRRKYRGTGWGSARSLRQEAPNRPSPAPSMAPCNKPCSRVAAVRSRSPPLSHVQAATQHGRSGATPQSTELTPSQSRPWGRHRVFRAEAQTNTG